MKGERSARQRPPAGASHPSLLPFLFLICTIVAACGGSPGGDGGDGEDGVDGAPSIARAPDGRWIGWREHLIDSADVNGGLLLVGADGLAVSDLDGDGLEDIVSVHEDSGHVRIAFGGGTADRWDLVTLEDEQADGAEDVVVGDLNADGREDVLVACERGHLLYFENPGPPARSGAAWGRTIPAATRGRGSFIRVSLGDLDGDGRWEVVAANKGLELAEAGFGGELDPLLLLRIFLSTPRPISRFVPPADPLDGAGWIEQPLGLVRVPINAQVVDLDADGDLDVVGGGRGRLGLLWYENTGQRLASGDPEFVEREIRIDGWAEILAAGLPMLNGQTLKFHDFDGDGRTDVLTLFTSSRFGWLEQPRDIEDAWRAHLIGDLDPDHGIGLTVADIDGDGRDDVMAGGYSKGPREEDGEAGIDDPLGRLAWFRQGEDPATGWERHDISRRKRGMFDDFVSRDLDGDGDVDFIGTRGNSSPYDGVFWLEQIRTRAPARSFQPARGHESEPMPLPVPCGIDPRRGGP